MQEIPSFNPLGSSPEHNESGVESTGEVLQPGCLKAIDPKADRLGAFDCDLIASCTSQTRNDGTKAMASFDCKLESLGGTVVAFMGQQAPTDASS